MYLVGLKNLSFIKHADYRPWGCHMCKFHAHMTPAFLHSELYDEITVFVKMDISQFMYSYVADNYFPDFVVTPPAKLLVETKVEKIREFRRYAPSDNVPAHKVSQWRNQIDPIYASITPLFHTKYLNHGRELYDGTGDCTNFINKFDRYDLFQVVFLDFLFGNRDRIANCFILNNTHLILDTGFSDTSLKDVNNKVNYGSPSDYLEYHLTNSKLCAARMQYPTWFKHLEAFAKQQKWGSSFDIYESNKFNKMQDVVNRRAVRLTRILHACHKL